MDERRGFEDWLREHGEARARPPFASELRNRFLAAEARPAGPSEAASAGDCASQDEAGLRKNGVSRLESLLREHLSAPAPREGFRQELRSRFLSAAGRPVAPPRPELRSGGRRPRWPAVVLGLAAAAAAVLLLVLLPRPGAPSSPWRMVAADPGTLVVWAGRTIAPTGALEDLAAGDGALQVADGRLRLHYGEEFRMEVRPGSRVWLDPRGGRALRLGEGELFLQTFAAYGGQGLSVGTPETEVAVHGTTLGVRADDQGTCVCVLEGQVRVHEHGDAEARAVSACSSHLVFREGAMAAKTMAFAEMEASPAEAEHVAQLRAFFDDASF